MTDEQIPDELPYLPPGPVKGTLHQVEVDLATRCWTTDTVEASLARHAEFDLWLAEQGRA